MVLCEREVVFWYPKHKSPQSLGVSRKHNPEDKSKKMQMTAPEVSHDAPPNPVASCCLPSGCSQRSQSFQSGQVILVFITYTPVYPFTHYLPPHPPTPWTVNPVQHIISSLMDTYFMSSKWIPKNEKLNFLQKCQDSTYWSLNVFSFDLDHPSLPLLSIDLGSKWPPKFHMLKALCPCMVLLRGSGKVQRSLEGS